MNRALWKKCLAEAQWLWLALAVLLFAFCWVRVWIVTLFETSRFQAILEQVWDDYQQFFTVSLAELLTYPVRIGMTYAEPLVLVVMAVWGIARGSAAVSGEIGRGTMEMLLAQPISRLQAFSAQAVTTTVGVALLAFVSWLGIWIGIQVNSVTIEEPPPAIEVPVLNFEIPIPFAERGSRRVPMSTQVAGRDLAPAAVNLFALGFCMAGIATLVSSCDRYRWRTIGVATGALLVQYVMKGFGVTAESLAWMQRWTLFTPYEPLKWVSLEARRAGHGWTWIHTDAQGRFLEWGPLANHAVLLGIGLAAYATAALIFNRRDLPAPL
jgi:ABC-2 type transport system permease protein